MSNNSFMQKFFIIHSWARGKLILFRIYINFLSLNQSYQIWPYLLWNKTEYSKFSQYFAKNDIEKNKTNFFQTYHIQQLFDQAPFSKKLFNLDKTCNKCSFIQVHAVLIQVEEQVWKKLNSKS